MQRRYFVKLSAFAAATFSVPYFIACHPKPKDTESFPAFFAQLVDAGMIAETGRSYLAIYKNEKDADRLKTLIQSDLNASYGDLSVSDGLHKEVIDDFKNDKMVVINGWVLSRTEARQCALFSLTKS